MTALQDIERALVIGLGASGRAAAGMLLRAGKRVTVNDISTSETIERAAVELEREGAGTALGHHDPTLLEGVDLVVVSPGVRSRLPLLQEAERRGVPVWSEIELAFREARGPVVAVTGTNGKTTTVSMIEWILRRSGRGAVAAGNIGHPLTKAVEEAQEGDILVVEASSFQLVFIHEFRPRVAVLLNIAADHFDWHEDMSEYIGAKMRMWMNQREDDLVVCSLDDPLCVEAVSGAPARVCFFSRRQGAKADVFLSGGRMMGRAGRQGRDAPVTEIMRAGDLSLPGGHNLENAMAAAAAALALGVGPQEVGEAIGDFEGLSFRLQFAAETGGVRFYNDSKATNPHAAMRAVSAFDRPLVVILGGRNKGLGFEELAAALEERRAAGGIRAVYLIGEAAEEIGQALASASPGLEGRVAPGLEEVFLELPEIVEAGDVVLFSPACASFDRYEDYRDRGRHFQEMVERYAEERR